MSWSFGTLLMRSYGLLLIVATGGFLGAQIGIVPGVIQHFCFPDRALDPEYVQRWVHGGWLAGAGFALIGAFMGPLRPIKARAKRSVSPKRQWTQQSSHGVLTTAGACSLVCGFLGLMLGASFLGLWFSLAYSPLAPTGWASSIEVKKLRTDSAHERRVTTTDHPVALYLFATPIVIGATAGGLIGGFGAMRKSRVIVAREEQRE